LGKKLTKEDLKPIERSTPLFLKTKKLGWLTRLPILKQRFRKKHYPRGFDVEAAQIFPMNLQVADYESDESMNIDGVMDEIIQRFEKIVDISG